jgi:hypothetical protein
MDGSGEMKWNNDDYFTGTWHDGAMVNGSLVKAREEYVGAFEKGLVRKRILNNFEHVCSWFPFKNVQRNKNWMLFLGGFDDARVWFSCKSGCFLRGRLRVQFWLAFLLFSEKANDGNTLH